jgi:two-component system nitrogen regulation response regulator GlnG
VEAAATPSYRAPGEVQEEELRAALRAHQYRIQPTAAALGISRTSLYALIDASPHLRKARDLTREEIEACQRTTDDLDAMAEKLQVSRKALRRRMTQLGLP